MIILGVDPGSLRTGYGAIATDGRRHRPVAGEDRVGDLAAEDDVAVVAVVPGDVGPAEAAPWSE